MIRIYWDSALYREETAALEMLPHDDASLVVGVDLASPAHAAADIVRARRQGIAVTVHCVATDPLETMLARVSAQIHSAADAEIRRQHLTALAGGQLTVGGVPFGSSAPMTRETAVAAYFILQMADRMAVFTDGETARWSAAFGKPLRRIEYLNIPDVAASPRRESGVTVYAPSTPRSLLGFVEAALQMHGSAANFVTAEDSGELPETRVVITPEWWRPARALALARAGFHVVSPSRAAVATRARAFEYADISADALAAALDAAASTPSSRMLWQPLADRSEESPDTTGPKVSIIVRTYDRPALLERAIDSIARQTYSNVEIIVVNNGGPDVRHVVESASKGRSFQYVHHAERATIGTASNLGARAASGEYIGYLDDDDLLYPDHVALAMQAIRRTDSDLSYSDCVGEYAVIENGRKSVLGVGIYLDREFNRDALYASNFAPIHSIVHRRDLFDRFGYFDEELPVTDDWDLWLRAAHGGRFVHVGRPTCEYSWRIDSKNGNMTMRHQQDFVDCYKRITERWIAHVDGRQDIRQAQLQMLAMQEQRVKTLAEDPTSAAKVLLEPLLQNAVSVRGLLDEELR